MTGNVIVQTIQARKVRGLSKKERAEVNKNLSDNKAKQEYYRWYTSDILKQINLELKYANNNIIKKGFLTRCLEGLFALKNSFDGFILSWSRKTLIKRLYPSFITEASTDAYDINFAFKEAKAKFVSAELSQEEYVQTLTNLKSKIESYLQDAVTNDLLALNQKNSIAEDYTNNPLLKSAQNNLKTKNKIENQDDLIELSNKIGYLIIKKSDQLYCSSGNVSGVKSLTEGEKNKFLTALRFHQSANHAQQFFQKIVYDMVEHPWWYKFKYGLWFSLLSVINRWWPLNNTRFALFKLMSTLYVAENGRKRIKELHEKIYKTTIVLDLLSLSDNSEVKNTDVYNRIKLLEREISHLKKEQKEKSKIDEKEKELAQINAVINLQNELFIFELQKLFLSTEKQDLLSEARKISFNLGSNLVLDQRSNQFIPASAACNDLFYSVTQFKKTAITYIASLLAGVFALGIFGAVMANGAIFALKTFGLAISLSTPAGIALVLVLLIVAITSALVRYNTYSRSLEKLLDSEKIEATQTKSTKIILAGSLFACVLCGLVAGGVIAYFGVLKTFLFFIAGSALLSSVTVNPVIPIVIATIIGVAASCAVMALVYKGFKGVFQRGIHQEFYSYLMHVFVYSFLEARAEKDSTTKIAKLIGCFFRAISMPLIITVSAALFALAAMACFVTYQTESLDIAESFLQWQELVEKTTNFTAETIITVISAIAALVRWFFYISLFIDASHFSGEGVRAVVENTLGRFVGFLKKCIWDPIANCFTKQNKEEDQLPLIEQPLSSATKSSESWSEWWQDRVSDNPYYVSARLGIKLEKAAGYSGIAITAVGQGLVFPEGIMKFEEPELTFLTGSVPSMGESATANGQELHCTVLPKSVEPAGLKNSGNQYLTKINSFFATQHYDGKDVETIGKEGIMPTV